MNNTDNWLDYYMDYESLTPIPASWIECAVKQQNERVTVGLACSVLLIYSDLDKVTLQKQRFN